MFQKGENPFHPKKGSSTKVQPIMALQDIQRIRDMLRGNPRDYALFVVGINTNLRASDLLNLRIGQVWGLKAMQDFEIREQKTKKLRRLTMNEACVEALDRLLDSMGAEHWANPADELEKPIFKGKFSREPISVSYLNRMVKRWCARIGLKGNFGSHTLRKTWGYHQRVTFGVELPVLTECFNHATQKQTLTYLCIQPEEIKSVFENKL